MSDDNIKSPEQLIQDGILPKENLFKGAKSGVQAKPPADVPLATPIAELKSQAEIDREASVIKLKMETLRLRKEVLELEKLENDVLEIQRKKEGEKVSRETVQESLNYERESRIHNETFCTHMKGGDSQSMMNGGPAQGNDSANYAMIQHTLTTGITFRLCSRCGKTWFPKDPDYRWAMSRPTRNSPSTGSPSPGLTRIPANVRVTSEVPHKQKPQNDYNEYNS